MPFIFHSEKKSIFNHGTKCPEPQQIQKLQYFPEPCSKSPSPNKNLLAVSKQHPFRKLMKPLQNLINLTQSPKEGCHHLPPKIQRPPRKYLYKQWKADILDANNQSTCNLTSQSSSNLNYFPGVPKDGFRIHKQATLAPDHQLRKPQNLRRHLAGHQSNHNQERLKYLIEENPGPGSYDLPVPKNDKATVLYQGPSYNYSLPHKKRNSLESILLSIEQKMPKRQAKSNIFDCNYKNQNSPTFKTSVLKNSNLQKNGALLSLLFSKKKSQKKGNQSQTTCQSRMAATLNTQLFQDGYEKDEEKCPGPFSYNPNVDCGQKKDKKAHPFLSSEPKQLSYMNRKGAPGPGTYIETMVEQRQVFGQNQNKKPNKFEKYDDAPENVCAFSSTVPRELHFDTQNLCRQELYYSPKNSISDLVEMKIDKGSRSSKAQFGSSLERFPKDEIVHDDPYKYCFSKVTNSSGNINCPSLTFQEKRELFKPVENTVPPTKYNDNSNKISKLTENQLFRKLLQSKYQDEVILLKEKKKNMESVLIEENQKSVNIKSPNRRSEEPNPDSYQEYLLNKKMAEKQNIAFGYHKESIIDRAIEARKEVDLYYDTEPKWDIKSFNKEYGYEVTEN